MTSRQPTSPVASSQVLLRSAERLCYTRFLMGILLSVVSPTGWAQTQGAGYPPAGYYPQASQYPTAGRYPAPSPYPVPSQSPVQQGYPSASQYPAQRQNYPTPAYRAPTQRTSSRSTAPQNPGYGIYQVKPGDTLWRIAMNHRVSPGEIMAANSMSNDTVLVGQSLIIPGRGQSTQSVPAQYPAAPSYPVAPPPKTSYPSSVTSKNRDPGTMPASMYVPLSSGLTLATDLILMFCPEAFREMNTISIVTAVLMSFSNNT